MFKITTYADGTQSITTIQEGVEIAVIADGEEPVKVVEVAQLPKNRLGKVVAEAMRTKDKPVDLPPKKPHTTIKEPIEPTNSEST